MLLNLRSLKPPEPGSRKRLYGVFDGDKCLFGVDAQDLTRAIDAVHRLPGYENAQFFSRNSVPGEPLKMLTGWREQQRKKRAQGAVARAKARLDAVEAREAQMVAEARYTRAVAQYERDVAVGKDAIHPDELDEGNEEGVSDQELMDKVNAIMDS
jgi:hypothetical protein